VTLPSWVPPQESKPAPEPLLLVQAFVNTRDADTGTDLLTGLATAGPWLRDAGLAGPDAALAPADLESAREIRESLRALLAHNGGGPLPSDDQRAPLDALARAGRPELRVDPDGRILLTAGHSPGSLADGLVGLLLVVRDAQEQGSWQRLKICRNPECHWAFFDRSHARRGVWCDMATCGNMIKNRNFRARRG
jgi:predicted RNA-binding Zn ribbon-like protein